MKKIWQSQLSDSSTESEDSCPSELNLSKEHATETTEADQSESQSNNDVLMVHLLHLACSLKGLPVNALPELLLELNNLGLLSDRARGLAVLPPSKFKDVFDSTFEHHKVVTRYPTFWKSSGNVDPSSRFQSDFTELRFLGEGGFGSVVLCKNKLDGREYAVKKVRLSSNAEKNEKILREARILSNLYNKRIVRYYQAWMEIDYPSNKKEPESDENFGGSGGSFTDESVSGADSTNGCESTYMYIQMEYCPRTLRDHLDSVVAPLEDEFASRVLRQIAEGLEYMHDQGIIHRDLTPSNIFFDDEENIKIGDFGLAKVLKAEQVESGCSSSKTAGCEISSGGTIAHTSPEIGAILYTAPEIDVRNSEIDGKVDIFSLGLVYFELLNHFRTGSERIQALTDLKKKSELPSSWIQDYLEQASLVLQLTSQHPGNRPTAAELVEELMAV